MGGNVNKQGQAPVGAPQQRQAKGPIGGPNDPYQHGMRLPTPQQGQPKGPDRGPNAPYREPGMPPQGGGGGLFGQAKGPDGGPNGPYGGPGYDRPLVQRPEGGFGQPNGPYPQMPNHGMFQNMNPGQIMQMLQMQNSQQPQAGLGAISGAAPTGYNPGYM